MQMSNQMNNQMNNNQMNNNEAMMHDLFTQVELHEEIGKGSYAHVYSATHKPSGTPLAVKVIDVKKPHSLRSVAVEVNALNIIGNNHRNIAKLYGHAFEKTKAYLLLEYLPHPSLAGLLDRVGALPSGEVKSILIQLCEALQLAHSRGIAHHDIKSDNVIVTDDGDAKLIDWGLAIHQKDNSGDLCREFSGSPLYLPPEVLLHQAYNPYLADVWGLGVLAYELLTGNVPFDSTTYDDLVRIVSTKPVKFPKHMDPKLMDLLSGMLTKDTRKRFTLQDVVNHPWMQQQMQM